MYIPPISPDESCSCYMCKHYYYDTFHNEEWCSLRQIYVNGGGTCEEYAPFPPTEKQLVLFDKFKE